MNSSGDNDPDLVNFSDDIPSINQLETKDGLLSFPFDHLYACNSEGTELRQELQLDKEVEITTHGVLTDEEVLASTSAEVVRLTDCLTASENYIKRLKALMLCHLDLIQQQNDAISKTEKANQALKQENEILKSRLSRIDRRVTLNQRHNLHQPLYLPPPTATITKKEQAKPTQIMLNNFNDMLMPTNTKQKSVIYEGQLVKPKNYGQKNYENKNTEKNVTTYYPTDLGVLPVLDTKSTHRQKYTMIENKNANVKKEVKTEKRQDAMYTMTTGNSANPVIQRIQRSRRKGTGSLSRMNKMNKTVKVDPPVTTHSYLADKYDRNYTVNKKSKMINTYGKNSRNVTPIKSLFTGSLSDRLQLIDTTPTGEDPYQLGEAEMREQSPIPKLMLQKTNHGRMKICNANRDNSISTCHFYESPSTKEETDKALNSIKLNKYNLTNSYVHPSEIKKEDMESPTPDEIELDLVKTEPEMNWSIYTSSKQGKETSVSDFQYGGGTTMTRNTIIPALETMNFQELFSSDSAMFQDSQHSSSNSSVKTENTSMKTEQTTSLVVPNDVPEIKDDSLLKPNDKKRKRALSTNTLFKKFLKRTGGTAPNPLAAKPKAPSKAGSRARNNRSPVPGLETRSRYYTHVGDPDVTWYLGLDPDLKLDDIFGSGGAEATVEVPRWREKPYTSCYTLEGTENLDDKVFEKRHQKLEAEERRQLRWHMRRVREQRHVERLRQRQRDSWGSSAASTRPTTFTVWPQPVRDVNFLDITRTLPVNAFGEPVPALPPKDFMLEWIKTPPRPHRPCKRSKKTRSLQ